MTTFAVVTNFVVVLAVVVAILLFERRRARRIEADLRDMCKQRRDSGRDLPDQ